MIYVKTYLPTLKTHVVNLKRDAKDLSRDLQRLEVRGKLGSKTLYFEAVYAKNIFYEKNVYLLIHDLFHDFEIKLDDTKANLELRKLERTY